MILRGPLGPPGAGVPKKKKGKGKKRKRRGKKRRTKREKMDREVNQHGESTIQVRGVPPPLIFVVIGRLGLCGRLGQKECAMILPRGQVPLGHPMAPMAGQPPGYAVIGQ